MSRKRVKPESPPGGPKAPVTRQTVAQMLDRYSSGQVAHLLGISEDDVFAIMEGGRSVAQVVVRCNRSGRTFTARSWRGAYFRAQLLGLADWDWWQACEEAPA